jgi:hypothetical protein
MLRLMLTLILRPIFSLVCTSSHSRTILVVDRFASQRFLAGRLVNVVRRSGWISQLVAKSLQNHLSIIFYQKLVLRLESKFLCSVMII